MNSNPWGWILCIGVRVRKLAGFLILTSSALFSQTGPVIDQKQELPRHLINPDGALSEPSGDTPIAIAQKFLSGATPALGLAAEDLAGVYVAKEYRTEHNGVTHVLFRQSFDGVDVHGAAYKINIDRDGRILNAGGDLMKRPAMSAPGSETGSKALQAAVRNVNPRT
jgi:Zn-dependent metalloprotease